MHLFDAQVRFGQSLFGYRLDWDTLQERMRALDIVRALLVPVRPPSHGLADANRLVAATVARDPERLSGLVRVDPWLGAKAIDDLVEGIEMLGLVGLYLDPWEDHFVVSEPLIDPLVRRAVELGVPVMINGGYPVVSHPSQILAVAQRHPDATFIATHGGQINISGLLLGDAQRMMQGAPNIIFETSGVYREDFIEDCITEFGASRVIFGSGAPVFDQAFEAMRVHHAHVSDGVKRQIGWENSQKLFVRTTRSDR